MSLRLLGNFFRPYWINVFVGMCIMKTSELIEYLKKNLVCHGDLPVKIPVNNNECYHREGDVNEIDTVFEPDNPYILLSEFE